MMLMLVRYGFLSELNYEENSSKRIEAKSAEDLRVCLITKVAEEVAYQHIRRQNLERAKIGFGTEPTRA